MSFNESAEVSVQFAGQTSRYIPLKPLLTPTGQAEVAQAIVNVTRTFSKDWPVTWFKFIFEGQNGMTPQARELFHETSQNPVLLDSVGLVFLTYNNPSLPQLSPSSRMLKELWPK